MIDQTAGVLLFIWLNLALLVAGLALARQPQKRRRGLALAAGSGISFLALGILATRVSEVLFGVPAIDVDLRPLFADRLAWLVEALSVGLIVAGCGLAARKDQPAPGGGIWVAALAGLSAAAFCGLIVPSEPAAPLTLEPALLGAALGCLTLLAIARRPWLAAAPFGLSLLILAASMITTRAELAEAAAADAALPVLPAGFAVNLFARLDEPATSIAVDLNGDLYVATLSGSVLRLRDLDQDGVNDETTLFAGSLGWPLGVALHEGRVFISTSIPGQTDSGRVLVAEDTNGDGQADRQQDLLTGLPTNHKGAHQTNGLILGPDGRLYLGVGSTTDHSPEEYAYGAAILSLNPDGSEVQVYARGLRNPYGLAFSDTGELFATDNGPDFLDDTLHFVPPDELNLIVEGGDYGFPNYFGMVAFETGTLSPVMSFMMTTVPSGLAVYSGSQFPAEYHGNVFVALWQRGDFESASRSNSRPRYGQRVARVVLRRSGDEWQGTDYDFMTGLNSPVDIEEGLHGELFVADMNAFKIYRVTYAP